MMLLGDAHLGLPPKDWLEEEGHLDAANLTAADKVIAWQLSEEMRKNKITKMRMADLMETSRAQLERVLDPMSSNTTLETLQRAAKIVGRELR
jgi:antitoxin HicB